MFLARVQSVLVSQKLSRHGREPVWLNGQPLPQLKQKKRKFGTWKQGCATQQESPKHAKMELGKPSSTGVETSQGYEGKQEPL